jgi:hypothetical protein
MRDSSHSKELEKLGFVVCFMLVSYLVHFSTLKMESTQSSETSVDFQRTTWLYIPKNRTLQIIISFSNQADYPHLLFLLCFFFRLVLISIKTNQSITSHYDLLRSITFLNNHNARTEHSHLQLHNFVNHDNKVWALQQM